MNAAQPYSYGRPAKRHGLFFNPEKLPANTTVNKRHLHNPMAMASGNGSRIIRKTTTSWLKPQPAPRITCDSGLAVRQAVSSFPRSARKTRNRDKAKAERKKTICPGGNCPVARSLIKGVDNGDETRLTDANFEDNPIIGDSCSAQWARLWHCGLPGNGWWAFGHLTSFFRNRIAETRIPTSLVWRFGGDPT